MNLSRDTLKWTRTQLLQQILRTGTTHILYARNTKFDHHGARVSLHQVDAMAPYTARVMTIASPLAQGINVWLLELDIPAIRTELAK